MLSIINYSLNHQLSATCVNSLNSLKQTVQHQKLTKPTLVKNNSTQLLKTTNYLGIVATTSTIMIRIMLKRKRNRLGFPDPISERTSINRKQRISSQLHCIVIPSYEQKINVSSPIKRK